MADSQARIVISAKDMTASAFQSARANLDRLNATAAAVTTAFAPVGAAIAGALGGATVLGAFQRITDGLDALNDAADATGSTVENLSALEDAAARTGTSFDVVTGSLLKLNQQLANAKPGSEAEALFRALGLSVDELRAKDPAQALLDVSKAFENFADDGAKSRASLALFGRSSREVSALLKDLAESGELAAGVTTAQTEEIAKFNKAVSALNKNATDLGRGLAIDVVTALNKTATELKKADEASSGLERAFINLSAAFELARAAGLGALIPGLPETTDKVKNLEAAIRDLRAIQARDPGDLGTRIQIEQLEKQLSLLQRIQTAELRAGFTPSNVEGGRGNIIPPLARPSIQEDRRDPPKPRGGTSAQDYIEQLRAQQRALLDLSAVETALLDIEEGRITGVTDATRALILLEAERIDLGKQQALIAPELENQTKAYFDQIETLKRLGEQSDAARLESLADQARRAAEAFNAGAISTEDFARAAEVLGRQLDAVAPSLKQVEDKASETQRTVEGVLGDTLRNGLEGDFDGILDAWNRLLSQMVADAIAKNVSEAIFGKSGGGGGGANFLDAVFSAIFSGGFADGGRPPMGKVALVGERGPELFVPDMPGTVIPNEALGGTVVNINQPIGNVGSNVSRADLAAAMRATESRTVDTVLTLLRRNPRLVAAG